MTFPDFPSLARPAPRGGGFRMAGYWVWCGSCIRDEATGLYHLFASRWPKAYPMHPGWLLASEIVRATASAPEGPYAFQEVLFPARGAAYWDGRCTHNPHVTRCGEDYLLYYTGSTHPFPEVPEGALTPHEHPAVTVARSNKRIGLATAKSPAGPWQRLDRPILRPRPDKFDSFLTSNPAPCVHPDGSVLLVYKSRGYLPQPYGRHLHGQMHLGVARAPHWRGPYAAIRDTPVFASAAVELEDPFVWRQDGRYLMIVKDMDGRACGESLCGACAVSDDGIDWQVLPGRKAWGRQVRWDNGTTDILGNFERPFLLFEGGRPTHLFGAVSEGPGGIGAAVDTWNLAIPLGVQ